MSKNTKFTQLPEAVRQIIPLFGCLLFASCTTAPPQPQVQFKDTPSSLSPSRYQGGQDQGMVSIGGGDFVDNNNSAMIAAVDSQSAVDEAKRRERERARAEYEASRIVQTHAVAASSCSHDGPCGSAYHCNSGNGYCSNCKRCNSSNPNAY